jgi:hypothetical protein
MRAAEKGEEDRAYLAGTGVLLMGAWLGGTLAGPSSAACCPTPMPWAPI